MTMAMAERQDLPAMMEQVVMSGDLAQLSPSERLGYYKNVCESLGLNPLTKPFQYIRLNNKLTLYASKDCTEQLARIHGLTITISEGKVMDDIYVVKAMAGDGNRAASANGAVFIGNLTGENKANAFMKAETKASRRAVLRLVGLGWLDESEADSIPGAHSVNVDTDTGEIMDAPALPKGQLIIFDISDLGSWCQEQGITLEELTAVTADPPNKRNLVKWASDLNINDYDTMREEIRNRVIERREARNDDLEFLDGIPPTDAKQQELTGSAPNPNLPSAPISED